MDVTIYTLRPIQHARPPTRFWPQQCRRLVGLDISWQAGVTYTHGPPRTCLLLVLLRLLRDYCEGGIADEISARAAVTGDRQVRRPSFIMYSFVE